MQLRRLRHVRPETAPGREHQFAVEPESCHSTRCPLPVDVQFLYHPVLAGIAQRRRLSDRCRKCRSMSSQPHLSDCELTDMAYRTDVDKALVGFSSPSRWRPIMTANNYLNLPVARRAVLMLSHLYLLLIQRIARSHCRKSEGRRTFSAGSAARSTVQMPLSPSKSRAAAIAGTATFGVLKPNRASSAVRQCRLTHRTV